MSTVADAYVDLHVNGDSIEGEIRQSLRDAEAPAGQDSDRTGRRLGDRMAKGFIGNFAKRLKAGSSSIGKEISEAFSSLKGFSPKSLMIPALISAVPLLTSAISALGGTLVAFVGSVSQAVPGLLALSGLVGGAVTGVIAAKIAFSGLGDAMKALSSGDAEKINEAMKKLHPNAAALVRSVHAMGPAWGNVKRSIQGNMFAGLDTVVRDLGNRYLPILQKQFGTTATVMNGMFKRLGGFVTTERYAKNFSTAISGNNKILSIMGKMAVPLLRGITNMYIAMQPAATKMARSLLGSVRAFSAWAVAGRDSGSIAGLMDRAGASFSRIWQITKNLGRTLYNVFSAATPAGNDMMKTLEGLTGRLADFTGLASTKNSIATWAEKSIEVTGRMFTALGRGFKMLGPLFNPDLIGGFMDAFGKMMPTITAVVKVVQGALMPIIENVGAAFAKNGPKFAGLFSALGPLLAGIGAVLGNVVSQALDMLGSIAGLITPIVRVISNFLGPLLAKFAPIIATMILAFTTWGGTLVKMVPYLGKFLAPLVKLAEVILKKAAPIFMFFGKTIALVFKGISKIVVPVMKGLWTVISFVAKSIGLVVKTHFTIVKFIITNVLKGALIVVRAVFGAMWAVIGPIVRMISGLIKTTFGVIKNVISTVLGSVRGVITTVFGVIRNVVSASMGALKKIITSVWGGIKTVFTVSLNAIRSVITRVWNGIKTATSAVWNGIKWVLTNTIGGMARQIFTNLEKVIDFVKGLPRKILNLASSFANAGKSLGKKIVSGLWDGLKKLGSGAKGFASSIKKAINDALKLPFKIGGKLGIPEFEIPAFARGTNFAPGGLSLVGERGPELVNLPRGSQVRTAQETRRMLTPEPAQNGPGLSVYIDKMMPHNYSEFSRQMDERRRLAALGGRRIAT